MATILVIEDERDILDIVAYNLGRAGFEVLTAEDGRTGLDLAREHHPDLIVLDLMLPGLDGKEVCRQIRRDDEVQETPILMLTALVDETDRVIGFELGADDYLTKPFSPRELVLRIQAILRRTAETQAATGVLRFPDLLIDPERHRVEVQGREVTLTATEFRLLHYLAVRAGRAQTREVLLDQVWGYSYEGYARTVDTHMRRLRRKLGPLRDRIETLRGVGYRFREEP
jgi:two-component system phosphate regulon response regulator PhoB